MSEHSFKNLYDDGNIPQIDLPQSTETNAPASNVLKAGTYWETPRSPKKDNTKPPSQTTYSPSASPWPDSVHPPSACTWETTP